MDTQKVANVLVEELEEPKGEDKVPHEPRCSERKSL